MTSHEVFAWVISHIGLAEVVLIFLLSSSVWLVWMAQKRADFDFADMLRDDSDAHKPSALRLGILGSFAISSWVILHDGLAGTLTDGQFWAYMLVWSGAKVAEKFADKWDGRMPWARQGGG